MDVSDIGKRDLGTPFTLCCKAQELRFQQHVNPKACRLWLLRGKKKSSQRPGRFSTENLISQHSSKPKASLWPFKFYPQQYSQ